MFKFHKTIASIQFQGWCAVFIFWFLFNFFLFLLNLLFIRLFFILSGSAVVVSRCHSILSSGKLVFDNSDKLDWTKIFKGLFKFLFSGLIGQVTNKQCFVGVRRHIFVFERIPFLDFLFGQLPMCFRFLFLLSLGYLFLGLDSWSPGRKQLLKFAEITDCR